MPVFSVKARRREPEWMDQPGLDRTLHDQALAGLRRVNRLSGTALWLWRPIARLAKERAGQTVRILDLASGGGDVAVGMALAAGRANVPVEIAGCDVSASAVNHAQANAVRAGLDNVRFFVCDALEQELPAGYDVVTCSLFLHHLDDADAAQLLQKMAAATQRLVLVDDLRRSRSGYALAWIGCQLLTRSPVVHTDGPRSVRAAFTLDEAAGLADRAGLAGCRIVPHWPARFLLSWSKP
ncbi:MAG TPA: methyltransferase domain-containing protein [Pirellulales bacterium]|nr:methyltransferase domain-containing protein [Pirellulales bacterium]